MKKRRLEEFVEIYKKVYGEEINEADALRKATKLLELYRAVYGEPLEDYKNLNNHEK